MLDTIECFSGVEMPECDFAQVQNDITKTRLFKYIENFTTIENFQIKNSDIFHISAQNIDCGYSLEPPHRGPQSMFFEQK